MTTEPTFVEPLQGPCSFPAALRAQRRCAAAAFGVCLCTLALIVWWPAGVRSILAGPRVASAGPLDASSLSEQDQLQHARQVLSEAKSASDVLADVASYERSVPAAELMHAPWDPERTWHSHCSLEPAGAAKIPATSSGVFSRP